VGELGDLLVAVKNSGGGMRNKCRRVAVLTVLVAMTMWAPSLVRPYPVEAATAAKLTALRGIDDLKTLFNQDKGKVRLVLLVSPT